MATQFPGSVNLRGCAPERQSYYSDIFKVFQWHDTVSSPQVVTVRVFRGGHQDETRQQRLNTLLTDFAYRLAFIPRGRSIAPTAVVDALTGRGIVRAIVRPWFGQKIFDHLKTNGAVDKLSLIIQIAIGIESLHTRGLVHGNISPDDIFVTADGSVSITDAGVYLLSLQLAFELDNRVPIPKACVYKPAEELNIDGMADDLVPHTTAMDVYSWAVTAFAIIIEKTPFSSGPKTYLVRFANSGFNTVPKPSEMSDSLWNLLRLCWDEDPTRRPSMTEIVDYLEALPSFT